MLCINPNTTWSDSMALAAPLPIERRRRSVRGEPRERPDRKEWVRRAMVTLADRGVEAVRVEVLAKELNVTKGSFYSRFHDRNDLLSSVLLEWRRSTVTSIAEQIVGRSGSGREKLQKLWRICLSGRFDNPGGTIEAALEQWGRRDPAVAQLLAATDLERIGFITSLYREDGVDEPDVMGRAFYQTVLGRNLSLLRGAGADSEHDAALMRLLQING